MRLILSSREMKDCDTATIEHFGVPSVVLMEKASLQIASEIRRRFSKDYSILIVCGSGNNGGDGFAVGRILFLEGYPVTFYFAGKEEKCTTETKRQLQIAKRYEIPFIGTLSEKENKKHENTYDVIVDALFGNGLVRDIEGVYAEWIRTLNDLPGYKIAVDLPSGISADTGAVMGCAFRADLTVAVAYAKRGHLLYPGAEFCGELVIKDIGISEHSFLGKMPSVREPEEKDLYEHLPVRAAHSNKGTFGKVLVIAGSKGMAGAACFAAKAAYRSGCGLVKVFTSEDNRMILQNLVPEAVLATYEEDHPVKQQLTELITWADVIVAGPGLGQGETADEIIRTVLNQSDVPTILDADALNLISRNPEVLKNVRAQTAITPHIGEMARLTGKTIPEIKNDLIGTAQVFAGEYQIVCLLKDAHSVCAVPSGETYLITSGNSGMATAGSGDVLTGIIGALCGMGLGLEEAVPYGAYLHGMAGSYAAAKKGQYSLMASDILEHICKVWKGK